MTPETYDVYFSGATLKNADPDEAKQKIGAMFKLQGEQLERLFSGTPIPIKRGVDMDRAIKYRVAFRDAGALVDIVPAGQPVPLRSARPEPPPRPSAPPPPVTTVTQASADTPNPVDTSTLTLADGPMNLPPQPPVEPVPVPDYDLSAAQDFNLSDCAPAVESAPLPDISALDLEKAGSIIDESRDPEPLEIDTDALSLDAPGVTLIEARETPSPSIDTEGLTLSGAREGSLEDCQKPIEPVPLPDIGHLHLEEGQEREKPEGKARFVVADD